MANIKSAKKRILQDAKKTLRNKMLKSQTQTAVKKYIKFSGDVDQKKKLHNNAISLLDKAVSKGIYHRNKSARVKSRLQKYFVVNTDKKSVQSTNKKIVQDTEKQQAQQTTVDPSPASEDSSKSDGVISTS